MAHGKETPRQKMIGMMYLVLTALLALNVSTSVLDAFKIIDEGLSKTNNTLEAKIFKVYEDFEMQEQINPSKAGAWKEKAFGVRQRADSLVKKIRDLKLLVVQEAEAGNKEAIQDGEIVRENIKAVTDYDTPNRILIGAELTSESKARKLKEQIEEYKNYLMEFIPEENVKLRESIMGSLDTEDEKDAKKSPKENSWEYHKFGHSPLMGFLAIMSNLQINVRNAEIELVNYLYSRIDEGSVKFNKLEATVIPNTNYVIRGNKYRSEVFIAAFDTTNPPEVFVTEGSRPYEEVKDAEGRIIDYKIRDDLKYELLPIEKGKAVYERPGGSPGFREWGGIIEVQGPGEEKIRRPFKQSYQVAESNVVVSPTKMNVFYYGVDNPVDISVAGIPANQISAVNTNGSITPRGGSWIVNPRRPGFSTIRVFADFDGQKREVGFKEFRVKTVPDPVAKVAGKKGGGIEKNLLLAATGVQADMEGFDFDLTFRVTEFTVLAVIQGFVSDNTSKSNAFTQKQKDIIKSLSRGSNLYIQDIKAVGPDGTVRILGTIYFKIN
ncbi:MAG: gliding motility protein GldM [Bacteroidales bacterium]|nr:gliding motility protein GldM [Bacteroidales bacterium]